MDIVIINYSSIWKVYVCLGCCCCEVVCMCWKSLDFVVMGFNYIGAFEFCLKNLDSILPGNTRGGC